jgi:hypothetical protein
MYSGLNHYLFNNTHWSEHSGLRRVIPTENAAFKIKEILFKYINQTVHAGGTSCDLAKVFGSVNHESSLPKLHFYGNQGVSAN